MPQVQIQLLRSILIFNPLPSPELEGLTRAVVPVGATAGSTLITEGEPGDFYTIADGRVRVTKRGQDVPRTATMAAITDVSLHSLEKQPFVLALTGHAPAARAADDLAAQRLEKL